MIETYAAGARALAVLASAHLIGTSLFLLRAGLAPTDAANEWERRWRRTLPFAGLLLLASLVAMLHAQACSVAGGLAPPGLALELARETAAGRLWCGRMLLAIVALLTSACAFRVERPRVRLVALLATLAAALIATGMAPLNGHAAGTQYASWLVPLHMAHLLALCAWLGALPAWVGLARTAVQARDATTDRYATQAFAGFSRLAMLCMGVIVVSGLPLALTFIADQGDMLGTRYGLLLCAKLGLLAVVLRIANTVRRQLSPGLFASVGKQPRTSSGLRGPRSFLPTLGDAAPPASQFEAGAASVRREWRIALAILLLGATLAQTPPAIHDDPAWWLPFRWSIEATWPDANSRIAIWLGAALLALAGLAMLRMQVSRALGASLAALSLGGAAISTWGLSVPAYPDTFRRPPVPYLSLSIDRGRQAFEAHCTSCHGKGGLGDGALAASMRKPPANLSEPHTALHTPGDMYWWFTHGMPAGPMPGFADVLDDEQRWDLVNFLRTFSQGFQARVLGPQIVPGKPWLGAPDFYYDRAGGGSAQLEDLRGERAALLLFTAPGDARSQARLDSLKQQADPSFALIAPQTEDVWASYQFLTRTLTDRGASDALGLPRRHVEFLVDRFGYLRARWIPAEESPAWGGSFDVHALVARLAREPQILPPPDLHLH